MPLQRLAELNTKDCLWVYVLRILQDGPRHAYVIRREISERFGFEPGTVTAYKVLYLLAKSGYVKKSVSGRQKVYALTPAGRKALREAIGFYKTRVKALRTGKV
ncbi:MAG TPA: helix-turn-helix transcriptional regulator [archaeon]|nr:helix-turn-helix transcriptional regulator [archaeon]